MQTIKDFLSPLVPATFKDARMTLENVLANSALGSERAQEAAYAVAVSLSAKSLAEILKPGLTPAQVERAEVAVAIMGMTNIYYSFMDTASLPDVAALPAQLRMVTYGQQATLDKTGFEVCCLAVSIVGKCKPCVVSHVSELKTLGFTAEQFRDLARLAGAVNAMAKVI